MNDVISEMKKSGDTGLPHVQDKTSLRDRHFLRQVHVLNGIEELRAFFHRALESFPTGDKSLPTCPLVDDGGLDGFGKVCRS